MTMYDFYSDLPGMIKLTLPAAVAGALPLFIWGDSTLPYGHPANKRAKAVAATMIPLVALLSIFVWTTK